jgi:hypothetical protein
MRNVYIRGKAVWFRENSYGSIFICISDSSRIHPAQSFHRLQPGNVKFSARVPSSPFNTSLAIVGWWSSSWPCSIHWPLMLFGRRRRPMSGRPGGLVGVCFPETALLETPDDVIFLLMLNIAFIRICQRMLVASVGKKKKKNKACALVQRSMNREITCIRRQISNVRTVGARRVGGPWSLIPECPTYTEWSTLTHRRRINRSRGCVS